MQNIDKPTASCTTSPQRTYFSRVYQLEDSTPLSDLELGEIPEDEDSDHMQHFVTDSSKKKTNSYRTESFWKSYDILYKEYIAVSRSHRASSTTDNYEEVSVWRHADRALQATIKFSELCFANPENPPPFLEMEVVKSMLILYRDQVMQRPKQINLTEYGDAVKFTHQANWQIFQIDQLVKGERPPADTIPTFQQVASQLPAQELKSQRRRSVMIARYYHALSDLDSKWLYYDAKMKKIRQQRDEISEEMAKMNSSLMRVLGMDLTQFRLQYYTNKPSPIIDD